VTTIPTLTILPFLFSSKISKFFFVCKMFEIFDNVNLFNCVLMNCSISCCLYYTLIYRGVCVCLYVRMHVNMYIYCRYMTAILVINIFDIIK